MSSSEYRDSFISATPPAGSRVTAKARRSSAITNPPKRRKGNRIDQGLLPASDPWKYRKILQDVFAKLPGEWAAKSAIDIALMDWVGQKLGMPLVSYFGLDPDAPVTTFSIGIDTPEITKQKAARPSRTRC